MMAGANKAKSDSIQGGWGKKRRGKHLLLALHQWTDGVSLPPLKGRLWGSLVPPTVLEHTREC